MEHDENNPRCAGEPDPQRAAEVAPTLRSAPLLLGPSGCPGSVTPGVVLTVRPVTLGWLDLSLGGGQGVNGTTQAWPRPERAPADASSVMNSEELFGSTYSPWANGNPVVPPGVSAGSAGLVQVVEQ